MHHSKDYQFLILILILLSNVAFSSSSSKVPAIIVFGDSTVDAGNNNHIPTMLKSNFRPYGRDFYGGQPTGRFGNGRLATDFIAEAFGLGPTVPAYLDPAYDITDFAIGVCFASAGTGLDNATSDVLSVIPLWKEVEYFKEYQKKLSRYVGIAKARQIVNQAVYVISIGTNDFLINYFLLVTGRFKEFTIDEYEDFLIQLARDFLMDIYRLGARKVAFTGLTPMGCLPLERTLNMLQGHECIEEYNEVARDFNVKLQALIEELCATLPGLKLRYAPVYDLVLGIIHNPGAYGLENVRDGCCASGKFEMGYLCNELNPKTCTDANKYLFWDSFHPTERVSRLTAEAALTTGLAEFL